VALLDMLSIECLFDVSKYVYRPSILLADQKPVMLSLSPRFAFIDDTNIDLTLEVTPALRLLSLQCRINDVVLKGTFIDVGGKPAIRCSIPSWIYLEQQTELPLPLNDIW
jgi:hypothetical protein